MKNLPALQETWVRFLGQEDSLPKEMATHSNGRLVARVGQNLAIKPPPGVGGFSRYKWDDMLFISFYLFLVDLFHLT